MNGNNRFLLIHPEISRGKYNFAGVIDNEPLELEYLYAILQAEGYTPEIWDGQVEEISLAEKLKRFMPEYVYVCGRTRQENFMKEYCKAAKEICGSITFVGGLHAQLNFKRFYENTVDYILTTFDLYKIPAILRGDSLWEIDGICFRNEGGWTVNPAESFQIEQLPYPDRTYFYAHSDRYRYLELIPCAHVRTAYSCPYRCRFCYRNQLNCGVYTARRIQSVVEEIQSIACENIYLIDDDFLADADRVMEFIQLIKEKRIRKRFVCYGRADFISRHPELIQQLKEIGFYYILAGLEAVSDKYLADYNKLSDMSCNTAAVEICHKAGIHLMGMFIVDLDFVPRDFAEMYRWIRKHSLKHAAISIFTPEMSSSLLEEYRDRLITENPEAWDYLHVVAKPAQISVKRFYFHYHILVAKLFVRGWRDGIYDFIDYGFYIKSILKNMFRFGG